ncbi:hypothetical protein DJ010_03980 [Nocardioides silvaticus]|uniref:Uncharacterized protein n=1 Tax=Nocardioides silvaticus TaxID=2201891 RepID=A0A316TJX2_9ACTN|nr:hypothetical protein DJ010_03980 [Nocardioides silvaticus]
MLCPVALHDELVELRAEVGPQVFDDPVAFRAAFDDFVPEGSATTGEVSLLVGAIATGALQRLVEQLDLGVDPSTAIAMQGDLLARDRGTTETSGARWALSALAHALGVVPVDLVLTRPTPGPEATPTAGRPSSSDAPADPGPTRPVAPPVTVPAPPPPVATHVISEPTPSVEPPSATARRRANPLLLAVAAALAVVAVVAIALLVLRDDDSSAGEADDDTGTATAGESAGDEEILAQTDLETDGATSRLQLVRNGTDVEVVLLADEGGDYVEVDRQPSPCPYLDASFDAGIEAEGGNEFFYGWQTRGNEGFGGYGQVQAGDGVLIVYEVDAPCPTER